MIRATKTSGNVSNDPTLTDGWARLAVAVLAVAAEDARAGDVGAAEWLTSDEAAQYGALAGIEPGALADHAARWAEHPAGKIIIRVFGGLNDGNQQTPCFGS